MAKTLPITYLGKKMKRTKPPNLVTLAVMTTITVILWIGLSVYRVLTTKPPIDVPLEILEPISADLETDALAQIKQRVYFEKGETVGFFVPETPISLPLIEEETEAEATAGAEAETEEVGTVMPTPGVATEAGKIQQ